MKKYIIIAFFSLAVLNLSTSAQKTEGKVKYLTTYNWVKMMNACSYLSKEKKDKVAYIWGNRSEWKVFNNLYFTVQQSKYEDSEEKAEQDDYGYSGRKDEYYITRNFEKDTYFDVISQLGKVYLVKDTLDVPDWKILNDIKEVAGHVCMNARYYDTLMSQQIIAWFALDIPVKAGPDRFFGLPGLILEVNVNNGAKLISAETIEFRSVKEDLELPKKIKGKQVSEKEYKAVVQKFIEQKRAEEEFPWGLRY